MPSERLRAFARAYASRPPVSHVAHPVGPVGNAGEAAFLVLCQWLICYVSRVSHVTHVTHENHNAREGGSGAQAEGGSAARHAGMPAQETDGEGTPLRAAAGFPPPAADVDLIHRGSKILIELWKYGAQAALLDDGGVTIEQHPRRAVPAGLMALAELERAALAAAVRMVESAHRSGA
jgi:hypothetical protein